MDVNTIIVFLIAVMAVLAIGGWFLDQWLEDDNDDDDWDPYS